MIALVLPPAAHAHFQSRGVALQSDALERVYAVAFRAGPLAATLSGRRIDFDDADTLDWEVNYVDQDGEDVFAISAARLYSPHWPSRSDPAIGAVPTVYNMRLEVRKDRRRQGIASALYNAERVIHQNLGVKEVQMDALGTSCVVWIRSHGFEPVDPDDVLARFAQWRTQLDPASRPRADLAISDMPEAFFKDAYPTIELFRRHQ